MAREVVSCRTVVAAPVEEVWRHASTMRGVNWELRPLARLTRRGSSGWLEAGDAGALPSWVLLAGVVPIDRHRFRFDRVTEDEGFEERSSSWLHRSWIHHRTVTGGPTSNTAIVEDRVWIEPRLRVLAPLVRRGARAVFAHRHRRLQSRFPGARPGPVDPLPRLPLGS